MMVNVAENFVPEPELFKKIKTPLHYRASFSKNTGELIDSVIKANEKGKIKIKKLKTILLISRN